MGGWRSLRLLLDTHALLWWAATPSQLPVRVRGAIAKENTEVNVSAATAWEIATKVRLGKLSWPAECGTVSQYVRSQNFKALPVAIEHGEHAGRLLIAHRDPFDRMLIAQALSEDLWLVSNEELFDRSGVRRYW